MPDLRVVPSTGEVADGLDDLPAVVLANRVRTLRGQVEGLTRDLALAEEGMRELRASRSAYKALLTKMARAEPEAETIERCLAHWKNACRSPRSTVEIPLDGKRAAFVRKTLKRLIENDQDPALANPDKDERAKALQDATQRAEAAIHEAIEAAARFPYREKYGQRHTEPGPGRYKQNDIPDILKDEITLAKFRALHDGDEKRRAYAHDLYRRMQTQPQLRAILASFDPDYGELLARAVRWCQAQERPL